METITQAGDDTLAAQHLYRKVILLVGLAFLITTSDLSIANVALKSIGEGLSVPPNMLAWVISATALTLAGFLILGGRASDIYGPRNCLLVGLSLFGLGSALSAFAIDIDMLIVTRALQGIGGAILLPSSLSLINTLLPEGPVRHRAFGILGVMQGLSAGIGLVLGGVVATSLGWRACFFINLPLIAVALLLVWQVVPRLKPGSARQSLDYPGAILVCGAIALIIFALSAIGAHGFASIQGLGLLGAGFATFLLFFIHEGRTKQPLVPLPIFRYRNVIGANLATLWSMAAAVGMFVMIGSYMQTIVGLTPMATGLAMIPYVLAVMLSGQFAHFAMSRWPLRANIIAATIIELSGLLILAWSVEFAPGYWIGVLPGMCIAALGIVFVFVTLMADGTAAVPAQQQGVASALVITSQQMSIAVGVSIALMTFDASVAAGDPAIHSFRLAFGAAAGMGGLALFLVLALIRRHKKEPVDTLLEATT